jgi:hypothetical protein
MFYVIVLISVFSFNIFANNSSYDHSEYSDITNKILNSSNFKNDSGFNKILYLYLLAQSQFDNIKKDFKEIYNLTSRGTYFKSISKSFDDYTNNINKIDEMTYNLDINEYCKFIKINKINYAISNTNIIYVNLKALIGTLNGEHNEFNYIIKFTNENKEWKVLGYEYKKIYK